MYLLEKISIDSEESRDSSPPVCVEPSVPSTWKKFWVNPTDFKASNARINEVLSSIKNLKRVESISGCARV